MEHILDNPAWNALISGNKYLSFGNDRIRYFDKDVSPFAALEENTADNFRLLCEILPHNGPVLFVTPAETEIPAGWRVPAVIKGLQMVYDSKKLQEVPQIELIRLTEAHVPEMMALTKLTNPGPFAEKTIEFGHYYGVFENGDLAAMAGQRLHAFNYAEISAVCTHPDYTGNGYAGQLLQFQINRIKAAGDIPYLHVKYDNERAIKLYERMGFAARREVYFFLMTKTTPSA